MSEQQHRLLSKLKLLIGIFAIYIIIQRTVHSWNTQVPAFYYFTVLSNLLCASFWLYSGISKKKASPVIHGAVTIYMLITGVIFYLFINDLFTEGLYNALGNGQITRAVHFCALTCSTFTHYVFPALIVVDYLAFSKPHRLIKKDLGLILAFPIGYSIFHSILGLTTGQYLYPFLDPTRMGGWPIIGLVVLGLALMFVGIAYGLFALRRHTHLPTITLTPAKATTNISTNI